MRKHLLLWFSNLLFMVHMACGQHENFDEMLEEMYQNTVPLVQPEELKQAIDSGESIVVIDAREQREFEVSHLPNAVFVGYDNFNMKNVKSIPKDQKIVVYCSVGYRSERIGEKLKKAGFKDVSNLYGGIFQWKNDGFPVYQSEQKTDSVHAYSKKWGVWLTKGVKVYE